MNPDPPAATRFSNGDRVRLVARPDITGTVVAHDASGYRIKLDQTWPDGTALAWRLHGELEPVPWEPKPGDRVRTDDVRIAEKHGELLCISPKGWLVIQWDGDYESPSTYGPGSRDRIVPL